MVICHNEVEMGQQATIFSGYIEAGRIDRNSRIQEFQKMHESKIFMFFYNLYFSGPLKISRKGDTAITVWSCTNPNTVLKS